MRPKRMIAPRVVVGWLTAACVIVFAWALERLLW
jgi:hypothetical protein